MLASTFKITLSCSLLVNVFSADILTFPIEPPLDTSLYVFSTPDTHETCDVARCEYLDSRAGSCQLMSANVGLEVHMYVYAAGPHTALFVIPVGVPELNWAIDCYQDILDEVDNVTDNLTPSYDASLDAVAQDIWHSREN